MQKKGERSQKPAVPLGLTSYIQGDSLNNRVRNRARSCWANGCANHTFLDRASGIARAYQPADAQGKEAVEERKDSRYLIKKKAEEGSCSDPNHPERAQ